MAGRGEIQKVRARIRRVNHRLKETGADLCNADRALWGAPAIAQFAGVTGGDEDMDADPETVLSDLLADLMHWCDVQRSNFRTEAVEFDSALERARDYYNEEVGHELDGTVDLRSSSAVPRPSKA